MKLTDFFSIFRSLNVIYSLFVLSLLLTFYPIKTLSAQPTFSNISLNNFYQVSNILYRSEQPLPKEMQQLEKIGIKTIINLRNIHSDRDEAENTQLNLVWIPMRAGNINDDKIIKILTAIKDSPKPILIHCWRGSDRTGIAVAMYRLVFQNWNKEDAINELKQPRYGYHANIYQNIEKYLRDVDVDVIKAQVYFEEETD